MLDNFIRLLTMPKMEMSYLESVQLSLYALMFIVPLAIAWGLLQYWVMRRHRRR